MASDDDSPDDSTDAPGPDAADDQESDDTGSDDTPTDDTIDVEVATDEAGGDAAAGEDADVGDDPGGAAGGEAPDAAAESASGRAAKAKESAKTEVRKARERLEEEADRAMDEFDQGVVDLLAWLLDTETRARIFVYLRQNPRSTSEEVAEGTGLYPSTVREALAELHEEGTVTREKRESAGAGNNPYEYRAIAPSELVSGAVEQVQSQLNAVFNLDRRIGRSGDEETEGPVKITVSSGQEAAEGEGSEEAGGTDGDGDVGDAAADSTDDTGDDTADVTADDDTADDDANPSTE